MQSLLSPHRPAAVNTEQWARQIKHNTFRLFNAFLRRTRFASAKGELHSIETELTAKKITTSSAWWRVQQLVKAHKVPADWTAKKRIVHSALSTKTWDKVQKQIKRQVHEKKHAHKKRTV
jgi:hypothetical protein